MKCALSGRIFELAVFPIQWQCQYGGRDYTFGGWGKKFQSGDNPPPPPPPPPPLTGQQITIHICLVLIPKLCC